MAVHQLKTWPSYFQAIIDGNKRHEIRKHDRDFKVGDVLLLREWDPDHVGGGLVGEGTDVHYLNPEPRGYTGRMAVVIVKYLTPGNQWGLPKDICVMSITSPSEDRFATLAANIAIAAALCRAHVLGESRGMTAVYARQNGTIDQLDAWRPGCGRSAL